MVEKLSQQWIDSAFAITHLSPTAVQKNCETWYRLRLWACYKLPDLNATECLQIRSTPVHWYSVAIKWLRNAPSNELIQPLQEFLFHPGPFKEIVRPGTDCIYGPAVCPVYAYTLFKIGLWRDVGSRYNCSHRLLLCTLLLRHVFAFCKCSVKQFLRFSKQSSYEHLSFIADVLYIHYSY